MRARHTSFRDNLRSLLRFWLVIPTLVVLGCASTPNLLPGGAPEYVMRDGVRRVAAAADYAVIVSPDKHAKYIEIRWDWRGTFLGNWYWWRYENVPFATARQVTFTLREPGTFAPALCHSAPITNTGERSHIYKCEFDVEKYFGRPLVGWLDISFEDPEEDGKMRQGSPSSEEKDSPSLEAVPRTYYLIKGPVPVEPPKGKPIEGQTRP